MNVPKDIESYDNDSDNYIPIIVYIALALGAFEVVHKNLNVSYNIQELVGFLLVSVGFFFQGLRRRNCGNCGKKMEKYFNGKMFPKYHYCKNCRVKINTLLRNRTT